MKRGRGRGRQQNCPPKSSLLLRGLVAASLCVQRGGRLGPRGGAGGGRGCSKEPCCLGRTGGLGAPRSLRTAQTDAAGFLLPAFPRPIPRHGSLWRRSRELCRKAERSSNIYGADKQLPWGLGRDFCLRLGPVRHFAGGCARIHI